AFVPRLQGQEGDAGILSLAGEGKAADSEDAFDIVLFLGQEVIAGVIERAISARQCRAGRLRNKREHRAGVLVRHETGRKTPEDEGHYGDDRDVNQCRAHLAVDGLADPALMAVPRAIEPVVEPAEEAGKRAVTFVLQRVTGLEDR